MIISTKLRNNTHLPKYSSRSFATANKVGVRDDSQLIHFTSRYPSKSEGFPIIFVHGGFHGAWCWDEKFTPYFESKGRQVHAVDWQGHGKSHGRERVSKLTTMDCVFDIKQVVDKVTANATNPKRVVLVGHSAGGGVVQKYAETFPGTVAGFATVGAFPPFGGYRAFINWFRLQPLLLFKLAITGQTGSNKHMATPELYKEAMFSAGMDIDEVARYQKLLEPEESVVMPSELSLRFVDVQKSISINDEYARIVKGGNVLVIGGAEDALFPPEAVAKAALEYGTAPVIFQKSGHNLMLDQEWQKVADCILDWLKLHKL